MYILVRLMRNYLMAYGESPTIRYDTIRCTVIKNALKYQRGLNRLICIRYGQS